MCSVVNSSFYVSVWEQTDWPWSCWDSCRCMNYWLWLSVIWLTNVIQVKLPWTSLQSMLYHDAETPDKNDRLSSECFIRPESVCPSDLNKPRTQTLSSGQHNRRLQDPFTSSLYHVCPRNKSFFGCSPLQYVVFVCVCVSLVSVCLCVLLCTQIEVQVRFLFIVWKISFKYYTR